VIEASEKKPFLSLLLKVEMPVARELLSREESFPMPSDSPAMGTGDSTEELLDAMLPGRVCSSVSLWFQSSTP